MTDQIDWVEIKDDTESSEFGESWNFTKDKVLIGTFIEMKDNVGKHKSKVYTIQKEDGSKVAVWGSTVLDGRMKNLTTGELVKIEYLGDKPTDRGKDYHDFSVAHKGSQSS